MSSRLIVSSIFVIGGLYCFYRLYARNAWKGSPEYPNRPLSSDLPDFSQNTRDFYSIRNIDNLLDPPKTQQHGRHYFD